MYCLLQVLELESKEMTADQVEEFQHKVKQLTDQLERLQAENSKKQEVCIVEIHSDYSFELSCILLCKQTCLGINICISLFLPKIIVDIVRQGRRITNT